MGRQDGNACERDGSGECLERKATLHGCFSGSNEVVSLPVVLAAGPLSAMKALYGRRPDRGIRRVAYRALRHDVSWSPISSEPNMPSTHSDPETAIRHAMQHAQWAGVRLSSETSAQRVVRNDRPELNQSSLDEGAMCEVLVDGHFGYAEIGRASCRERV